MLNNILQLGGGHNGKQQAAAAPPKHISTLPPDLISRIFSFLPVPSLPTVACVSRRWKVLVYNDEIYDPKLYLLGMAASYLLAATPLPATVTVAGGAGADGVATFDAKDRLVARLRQLPGGQFLPTNGKFLNLQAKSPTGSDMSPASATLSTPASPIKGEEETNKTISATLPDTKASHLIIGSGGLKAALTKAAAAQADKAKSKKSALQRFKDAEKNDGLAAAVDTKRNQSREAFKKVYVELYPYYVDFEEKSNDSLVFRDYSDLSEIAAVLSRLLLFDAALFLERDTQSISSNLHSTVQWFESRLLGQFDSAYDKHDIEEMRVNAYAAFQLNGGMGCVNVFVSKNPVFFDLTFNPSLLDSKLPTLTGPSMGYALADEFAKYMDHMLANCTTQAQLVSEVFVPSVNAMTIFMEKVFEDSISEYLAALVTSAKAREGLVIYLHTLASSIYSCSQLVELLSKNAYGVQIEVDSLKKRVADLFAPYMTTYLDFELEHLKKRFKTEIDKWDKRGQKAKADEAKSPVKKGGMMGSVKALLSGGGGMKRGQSQPLLTDVAEDHIASDSKDTATYDIADQSMNSLVSLELALHLMHTDKESLGRALVITANTDMTKLRNAVQKVFVLLLKVLGEKHLKPAFALAIDRLSKSTPMDFGEGNKMINMDSLQFFDLIQMGDLVQQMIQAYYTEDIRMWIDEQDFLSDIIIEKKAFERLLDDSVASGMDKAIQVLINQCEFLLISGHSLNDFNPGANEFVMDVKPTKACQQVMACLEVHTKSLKGSIEANTMEVFLSEVSVRLFQIIIKNIRRLQVSQTGAMQLICDFNRYYEWAYSLRLSSATKMFQALKELGNLFLADGSEELRSLVHDVPRFNGALRIEEIYELLQSRTDYREIRTQVEAKECSIQ